MLGKIITFMVTISVIFSILTKNSEGITSGLLSSGENAVELTLTLLGSMTLWGGITGVAKEAGLWEALAKVMTPLLTRIFKGLHKGSEAIKAISMNLAANMLGLGNASTPLGIKAMKLLEAEENGGEKASVNMIKLAVMNSCSLQIIPTTVAAMRLAQGSKAPMEILPCVLIVSLISLVSALTAVSLFERRKQGGCTADRGRRTDIRNDKKC